MKEKVQKFFANRIVLSVAFIIFGIVLIAMRSSALTAAVLILGLVLIGTGIGYALLYLLKKDTRSVTQIIIAILALVLGILLRVKPEILTGILPMVIGIFLLASAAVDLVQLWQLKMDQNRYWYVSMCLAVLLVILSIFIILDPAIVSDNMIAIMGGCLIYAGIMDLIIWYFSRKSPASKA